MRPVQFSAERIRRLLRQRRIATMSELKEALGTEADATVFRKLAELSYLSSYSHRGRYYTLLEIARFDDWGLWSHHSVRFSRHGTLRATAETLVTEAEAGWRARELEGLLEVPVQQTLLGLVRARRIARERVGGLYLYCASDPRRRRRQLEARRRREAEADYGVLLGGSDVATDEVQAALILFFSLLDEQQRRLYAGVESLKLGYGGDRKIAELLGLDETTIARGRRQLLERDVEVGRVRKAGGGRKRVEKKRRT